MGRTKNVDGIQVAYSPDEETERDAMEAEWAAGADARASAKVQADRLAAYAVESDPVFFSWQAGESNEQDWLDARTAIKIRIPKP